MRENILVTTPNTPNKGPNSPEANNIQLAVSQPEKYQGLLETISLLDTVAERMGEDRSGDWSGSGSGGQGGQGDDDDTKVSARDKAIANLPESTVMTKHLTEYIEKEIKVLRKEIRKEARKASQPGAAHSLNELYAKIRRLNGLLAELLEASVDTVKRFFIRIFIDKQSIA